MLRINGDSWNKSYCERWLDYSGLTWKSKFLISLSARVDYKWELPLHFSFVSFITRGSFHSVTPHSISLSPALCPFCMALPGNCSPMSALMGLAHCLTHSTGQQSTFLERAGGGFSSRNFHCRFKVLPSNHLFLSMLPRVPSITLDGLHRFV